MPKARFDFFDALEQLAVYAHREAEMLVGMLREFDPERLPEQLETMHELENAADQQTHEIFTHLAIEFITPIDREDIIALAQRLDDIVDYIEDVLQQSYMFNVQSIPESALSMCELISQATGSMAAALKEFRNFKKNSLLAQRLIEVNDFEEEGDRIYMGAIRTLYTEHTDDPIYVMSWSNIFLRMERAFDSCENVADMIATTILKNSQAARQRAARQTQHAARQRAVRQTQRAKE